MYIIAGIEDPLVINKILTHLDSKAAGAAARRLPPSRAAPGSMKTQCSCEKVPPPGQFVRLIEAAVQLPE